VKLIRTDRDGCVFQMGRQEKALLVELLRLYPLVPAACDRHRVSRKAPDTEETQRLLAEALLEHRRRNREQVLALLAAPERFEPSDSGFRFTLSPPQIEWLLQVLNDVRVGCWIQLGSPDPKPGESEEIDKARLPILRAMEAAGFFEMVLLGALDR
jgi:hypothetical protein